LIIDLLKSPYPSNYGQSHNLKAAALIGIFVTLFLYFFKPFGIQEVNQPLWKYIGYGIVTFLGVVLTHFIGPRVFPSFFEEKNYNLGKELVLSSIVILLIGLGNAIFNHFILGIDSLSDLFGMIYNTFLVGIFPLTFLSLFEYNRQLKNNLKASAEIRLSAPKNTTSIELKQEPKFFLLSAEDKQTSIQTKDLLYVESVGNYANVVQMEEEGLSRNLYRTTLKSLEEENKLGRIIRCHRSYIVNLDQVIEVKGNAQGLKLHLKDCDEIVPVSRKYIPLVKSSFENLN